MVKYISTLYEFKEEVNPQVILEDVFHGEDERVLGLEQYVLFRLRINYLPFFNQNIFVNSLHCVLFSIFGVNYLKYFAE